MFDQLLNTPIVNDWLSALCVYLKTKALLVGHLFGLGPSSHLYTYEKDKNNKKRQSSS